VYMCQPSISPRQVLPATENAAKALDPKQPLDVGRELLRCVGKQDVCLHTSRPQADAGADNRLPIHASMISAALSPDRIEDAMPLCAK